jgi:hypothetical protein
MLMATDDLSLQLRRAAANDAAVKGLYRAADGLQ